MGYRENFEELVRDLEEKVLPAILFYSQEMCKPNECISDLNQSVFVVVGADNKNQNGGGYIFMSIGEHEMLENWEIHRCSINYIQSLIAYAKKLKKEYEIPLRLLKECEEIEIKVATRIILVEKIKK